MRNCICSKVYINVGGLENSAGCERNLGRTQLFTHRLAALRLPPGGSSAAEHQYVVNS